MKATAQEFSIGPEDCFSGGIHGSDTAKICYMRKEKLGRSRGAGEGLAGLGPCWLGLQARHVKVWAVAKRSPEQYEYQ